MTLLAWLGTVSSGKGHPLEKLRGFVGVGDTVRSPSNQELVGSVAEIVKGDLWN
jgi:hypothetical protein